jgi:hypothetical protein
MFVPEKRITDERASFDTLFQQAYNGSALYRTWHAFSERAPDKPEA